jgi:hypothetical protein
VEKTIGSLLLVEIAGGLVEKIIGSLSFAKKSRRCPLIGAKDHWQHLIGRKSRWIGGKDYW